MCYVKFWESRLHCTPGNPGKFCLEDALGAVCFTQPGKIEKVMYIHFLDCML